jgi:hypothetical protein
LFEIIDVPQSDARTIDDDDDRTDPDTHPDPDPVLLASNGSPRRASILRTASEDAIERRRRRFR